MRAFDLTTAAMRARRKRPKLTITIDTAHPLSSLQAFRFPHSSLVAIDKSLLYNQPNDTHLPPPLSRHHPPTHPTILPKKSPSSKPKPQARTRDLIARTCPAGMVADKEATATTIPFFKPPQLHSIHSSVEESGFYEEERGPTQKRVPARDGGIAPRNKRATQQAPHHDNKEGLHRSMA